MERERAECVIAAMAAGGPTIGLAAVAASHRPGFFQALNRKSVRTDVTDATPPRPGPPLPART
jgi:hypothetical protein